MDDHSDVFGSKPLPSAGNIIKITLQELHVLVCTHFVERVAVHTVNDLMQQPLFVCSIFFVDTLLADRWVPGRALV